MAVNVQVLFDRPQREIASLIRDRLSQCRSAAIVTGFATVEGIEAIASPIRNNPSKLKAMIVGAGTYRAYEAFDTLISSGVSNDRLYVHLGHTRTTGTRARHRFYRYHPMLHSKVYLMDMGDNQSAAFIGSHNVTGFAMLGLNGEAAVLIEGPSDAQEFDSIRNHIEESRSQSTVYTPGMKEAFAWWTLQFVDGLRAKVNDQPRDGESKKTIVILAVKSSGPLPDEGDVIYFELPEILGRIHSLQAEIHIYIFVSKPTSPWNGLTSIGKAQQSLWCRTLGLELEEGGEQLKAHWYVESVNNPTLVPAPKPFRPKPGPGMQQVRVVVRNDVWSKYEYFFDADKPKWEPVFYEQPESHAGPADEDIPVRKEAAVLQVGPQHEAMLQGLDLIPPEDKEWFLVKELVPSESQGSDAYRKALKEYSPDSGAYILMSLRRREIDELEAADEDENSGK